MNSVFDRPVKARNFIVVNRRRRCINTIATLLITSSVCVALLPLIGVSYSVITLGWHSITALTWWTHSQAGMTAFIPGGGAYHAIVGSLLQGGVCSLISIPIGVMTAIYLVEYSNERWLTRLTSLAIDVLSGIPSIVAALFIYALWIATLGFNRSGFAVSLSLAILMIPLITRMSEEMLWTVPHDLKEASYALGIPKWKITTRIIFPEIFPGIVTGIILSFARIIGETAPLLVLVGYTQTINMNLFQGFMGSLTGMIYDQTSVGAGITLIPTQRLWGAALTLFILTAASSLVVRVTEWIMRLKYTRNSNG